ncbi:MAG TPA: DUF1653 domain-containing protein [Pirellulales bacterium]
MPLPSIAPGTYRHFKGGLYQVYAVAENVDSGERYVIYRPLYGEGKLSARNYDDFIGEVHRDGKTMRRFEFISDESPLGSDVAAPTTRHAGE